MAALMANVEPGENPEFCAMHTVSSVKINFKSSTTVSWETFVGYVTQWKLFNCSEAKTVNITPTRLG